MSSGLSPEADQAIRALESMDIEVTIVERDPNWIKVTLVSDAGTVNRGAVYIGVDGRLMPA